VVGVQEYAAVVLAGGAGRRLGGLAKPTLAVGGAAMLDRVLRAVTAAHTRVVVGPAALRSQLPAGVLLTQEDPPGGGPVAAAAAGLRVLSGEVPVARPPRTRSTGADLAAVLAADLPFLTAPALATLLAAASRVDGAVFIDGTGRRQLLCGVWRLSALRERLAVIGDPVGASVRRWVEDLQVAEVSWSGTGPPPWYDCDTEADLRRAERLAGMTVSEDGP
jgi:molybdopterin-guanine dinucleotide biosynthesis protein A